MPRNDVQNGGYLASGAPAVRAPIAPTVPFTQPVALPFGDTFAYPSLAALTASAYSDEDAQGGLSVTNVTAVAPGLVLTMGDADYALVSLPLLLAMPQAALWVRVRAAVVASAASPEVGWEGNAVLSIDVGDANWGEGVAASLNVNAAGAPGTWGLFPYWTPTTSNVTASVAAPYVGGVCSLVLHVARHAGTGVVAVHAFTGSAGAETSHMTTTGTMDAPFGFVYLTVARFRADDVECGTNGGARVEIVAGSLADNPLGVTLPD